MDSREAICYVVEKACCEMYKKIVYLTRTHQGYLELLMLGLLPGQSDPNQLNCGLVLQTLMTGAKKGKKFSLWMYVSSAAWCLLFRLATHEFVCAW